MKVVMVVLLICALAGLVVYLLRKKDGKKLEETLVKAAMAEEGKLKDKYERVERRVQDVKVEVERRVKK